MPKHQNPKLIRVVSDPINGMRQAEYTILGVMAEIQCSKCGFWKFAGSHRYDIANDTENGKPICKGCAS